jgi:nucleotide-binding universal stress UspA family protein
MEVNMFNRILVPLDGSELAECVFPYVEDIAKIRASTVELVTVFEPFEMPPHGGMVFDEEDEKEYNEYSKKKAEAYIQKIKDRFQSIGIDTITTLLVGKADESLVDYANCHEFDLIIMATHGRSGVERWIMGSIADKLVHYSTIPVLLIRALHCK